MGVVCRPGGQTGHSGVGEGSKIFGAKFEIFGKKLRFEVVLVILVFWGATSQTPVLLLCSKLLFHSKFSKIFAKQFTTQL